MADIVDLICTHMEFLGYEITRRDGGAVTAKHQTHFNVVFKQYGYGILFSAFFGINAEGKARKESTSLRCNAFNKEARVARAYLDDDVDLVLEATFPVMYDKAAFGVFLEAFNNDLRLFAKDTVRLAEYMM